MIKNKIIAFVFACALFAAAFANAQSVQYVAEEKAAPVFKAKTDSNQCGSAGKPLRIAGFVTNPPLGWVDIVSSYQIPRSNGFSFKLLEKSPKRKTSKFKTTVIFLIRKPLPPLKAGKPICSWEFTMIRNCWTG